MACLVIEAPDGTRRSVPNSSDGQFRWQRAPGEQPVGVDPNCEGAPILQPLTPEGALIDELDNYLGRGSGDWIKHFVKPVALLLGKSNCMPCETRRVVINAYAKLRAKYGKLKALAAITGLLTLSVISPNSTARKLKDLL